MKHSPIRALATTVSAAVAFSLSCAVNAGSLVLASSDISDGEYMTKAQEYTGFGCAGSNLSPQLSWHDAPEGTKAFALLVHDPDAPTGSGWWHWQVVNIPHNSTSLPAGAGVINSKLLPKGAVQNTNDYGEQAFGGACPPVGHGTHRYRFTLYALSKPLELPTGASAALTGYMVKAHTIEEATIEALYKRD